MLGACATGLDIVPEDAGDDIMLKACVAKIPEAPVAAVEAPETAVDDKRPCPATGADNTEATSGALNRGPDG